ncbi:hypothetical protein AMATHDRAFT_139665 [Amanita thiersii Skay4041]|uniref:L-2-hydroxyglutarate dehydrogenase, mitochondrial n=1 Tax=Amanita thiersii Skay4041 TaxID=703135 RepID=A0A2A9NPV7_9AGAR|nr:hypothetical protein AMATHDRAFT_139665 [Amanita thiersii Skay4041]
MQSARGLVASLNANKRYAYKIPESVVDFLVIGGGEFGLAIAQRLSLRYPTKSTVLVERHPHAGEETSSRNSEVIHAGLYYPPDSLKTRLCLRGRDLLYEYCEKHNIPYRKIGKLVVAHNHQRPYIENLYHKSMKLTWPIHSKPSDKPVLPTELLSGDRAREYEPDLSKDIVAALWSPMTGIVDSHTLMATLEKDIIDSEGGELVYSTRVVRLDPCKRSNANNIADSTAPEDGWVVQTVTGQSEDSDAMFARSVINAAGLSSVLILNSILPNESRVPIFYARGSYASYSGPGVSNVKHLIYPCPDTRGTAHGFQSLGTHLTLDLQGRVRFGPDIEWLAPPSVAEKRADEETSNFWMQHLIPDESKLVEMHRDVTSYLPDISIEGLQPGYVGIRPKIAGPQDGFRDFIFRSDYPSRDTRNPMISLLNIESPGLTSSLAIAEYVVEDLLSQQNR